MSQHATTASVVAPKPPRLGSILAVAAVLLGLYGTSLYRFLLFHTLIEVFTIVVAAGVFVIAWNARGYLQNNYLLFVGVASLFVAFLDLFHTLAYEGMGVFPTTGGNLATQLWVAARALESCSLVLAPFYLGRRLRPGVQLAAYIIVTAALLESIYLGLFPTCLVDGVGLTGFKIVAEYVIAALLLTATGLLVWKRAAFAPAVWRLVAASLTLNVAAELAFTQYVNVYGSVNLIGHFLRLISSFLMYKAIIETGLVQPFGLLLRELKLSQDRLQEYADKLEHANADLRRNELLLREQAADLAERNQELDTFTRTVAHDLKSPVGSIMTTAELICQIDLGRDEQKRLLGRVAATASDLSRIIDDLLLLARVRKEDVPRRPLDMAALVAAVRYRFEGMISDYRAVVTVADEWPVALGHGPWIEEVWANYLTNALRYGGPQPHIALGAAADHDGTVRFWVQDHGPGLSAEERSRLFVPFHQLGSGPGHGLGLSIVLDIVQKLGGHVGVDSEPGQGSLFYFTLPAA